ncbi:MAG: queuosine precursor transporter [Patescibacteria group bacterium]|jgi:hypothetical protein
MNNNKKISLALMSASAYTAAQIIANVLSTKITLLPVIGLAMDGGTVLYPLTFTLRDFVHKTCGKKGARTVVIFAAFLSLLAFFFFWLVGIMASDPAWTFQNDYENILMPIARITLASILAQVVSELIDTEVFSAVYKKFNDITGSLVSNFIALIVDSVIFCLIAFLGTMPFSTVLSIILSNILIKFIISLISAPAIRLIPRTAEEDDM